MQLFGTYGSIVMAAASNEAELEQIVQQRCDIPFEQGEVKKGKNKMMYWVWHHA